MKVLFLLFLTMVAGATANAEVKCDKFNLATYGSKGRPDDSGFFESEKTITVQGKPVAYHLTAGYLPVYTDDGQLKACMFFEAYTMPSDTPRPLSFLFNGGPGSSSTWLHLGAFGPRTLTFDPEGLSFKEPKFGDNESTLLTTSDLVFIDPVNTGYSMPATGFKPSDFQGIVKDYTSVGQFIFQYLNRFQKWSAQKYLVGESYGTIRAAALSKYLQASLKIKIDGIAFISSVLTGVTVGGDAGNDLPYILTLPSYAVSAQFHNKLDSDLQSMNPDDLLAKAKEFAQEDYARILKRGDWISDNERDDMASRLATYTGLSKAFILEKNLRISFDVFRRELLHSDGKVLSYLDGRISGPNNSHDPFLDGIALPMFAIVNDYFKNEIGVSTSLYYQQLKSAETWPIDNNLDSDGFGFGGYLTVMDELKDGMELNPDLRVYVATGIYDLTTTAASAEYMFSHLGLKNDRSRITLSYFPSGHMMYVHQASKQRLRSELGDFYSGSKPGNKQTQRWL